MTLSTATLNVNDLNDSMKQICLVNTILHQKLDVVLNSEEIYNKKYGNDFEHFLSLNGSNNNIRNVYIFIQLKRNEHFKQVYTFSCYNFMIFEHFLSLNGFNNNIRNFYNFNQFERYEHFEQVYTFSCYNSMILQFINMFTIKYFKKSLKFLFTVICYMILGTGDHISFCTGPMSIFKNLRFYIKK